MLLCGFHGGGSAHRLPVCQRSVEFAIHRQVGALIGILRGALLIEIDTQAGAIAGKHESIFEEVVVGKDCVGLIGVGHVFLDAEVVDGCAEVERGGHADRRKIGRAVAAGAHVIERGEVGDLLQMRDAAGVNDGHADVVDPLIANQVMRIPDGVEDLTDGDRRCGVFTNDFESFLQLCRSGIFDPEKVEGLELFPQTARLNGT